MNNLDNLYQDNNERKYKYDFDVIIRQFMMRAFKPFFVKDDIGLLNCIELGSFDGYSTELLLKEFDDVVVLEGSSQLCKKVRSRFSEDDNLFIVNSLFEDYHPATTYDNIFIIHTLEHLEDPVKELQHIKTWASVKGRLFIAVPNANAISRQIAVGMGVVPSTTGVTEGERLHGHFTTYNLESLTGVVKQAGLNVISSGGILLKALSNFQMDKALAENLISDKYLEAAYEVGRKYPDLCSSIYVICERED